MTNQVETKQPSIAFLFPGQGAQKVGMGRTFFTEVEEGRDLLARADAFLGYPLSQLILDGPQERLNLTANAQPAILLLSVALASLIGSPPRAVAGHSLGEYSAMVAAGAIRLGAALDLVHQRGRLMQEAVPPGQGAMAAILGAPTDIVQETVNAVGDGDVVIANHNCPGQVVISGLTDAVKRVVKSIKKGRGMLLPVSGPFHSPMMKPAEDRLRPLLEAAEISDARLPVYGNVDAEPAVDASTLREKLVRQVSRPVLWERTIHRMIEDHDIQLFVEIGPGKTLTQFIRRIDPSRRCLTINCSGDVGALIEVLGA